jgi:HEAT repeat protein
VHTLQDPDKFVRLGAAMALGRLGWTPAGDEEQALLHIAKQEWSSLPSTGGEPPISRP